MTINPTHYHFSYAPTLPKVPPNSPQQSRAIPCNYRAYNQDADESESEELYPDIDKAEGQGKTAPIAIPPKKHEWNNQHFGD